MREKFFTIFKDIPDNPAERLDSEIREVIKSGNFRFDTHTYILNTDFYPPKYFSLRLPFLVNTDFLEYLDEKLNRFFYETDEFSRFLNLLRLLKENTVEELAKYLININPHNTVFFVLSMDFTGIEPKPSKSFSLQLEALKLVKEKFPGKFLLFYSFNPKNILNPDLLNKAFSEDYGFWGISLYPSLGFLPSHPLLMQAYEFFEKKNIPVITNSGDCIVHTTKSFLNLPYWDFEMKQNRFVLRKQKKLFLFRNQYVNFFNNPENWKVVLKKYPRLRLCFAHAGGSSEWTGNAKPKNWLLTILELMEYYPNVYADISYLIGYQDFIKNFIELFEKNELFASRVLFGTDFPYLLLEGDFIKIRSKFVNSISSEMFRKIAVENPLRFLGLEV